MTACADMAGSLHRQEAMEVDQACSPDEALTTLIENNLSCNLRVLGCQLGLRPSDLDTLLPLSDHSGIPYQQQLFQILTKSNERELLTWPKLVSILRKAALKQYRVANRICKSYNITTGSSESDSLQSLRSGGSTESSLTFMLSLSQEAGKPSSKTYINSNVKHLHSGLAQRKKVKRLEGCGGGGSTLTQPDSLGGKGRESLVKCCTSSCSSGTC